MIRGYVGLGKAQAKGSAKGGHSDPACADGQTSSFFSVGYGGGQGWRVSSV